MDIFNKKIKVLFSAALICLMLISISMYVSINWKDSNIELKSHNEKIDIIKISATEEWNRTWGKTSSQDESYGSDIYKKTGDVYLAGFSNKTGDFDIILVKYNSSGYEEWNYSWNYGVDTNEYGYDVAVDQKNGDVYVTGYTNVSLYDDDLVLLKLNSTGQLKWAEIVDFDSGIDHGYGVAVDSLGYIYVTGYAMVSTDILIFLMKYNNNSVQIWSKTLTLGSMGTTNAGYGIAIDSLDNIYITGIAYNEGFLEDYIVTVKYNNTGDCKWTKDWGSSNTFTDQGNAIAIDSNDNIYVTGVSNSDTMVLLKYSNDTSNMYPLWEKTWNGFDAPWVEGEDLFVDSSNNVNVAIFLSDPGQYLVLQRYTSSGLFICEALWDGGNFYGKWARSVAVDEDNNLYLGGIIGSGGLEFDFILVKNPALHCFGGTNGNGNGDKDADEQPIIDFGNYHLIFTLVGISSMVIIIKRKINYKSK